MSHANSAGVANLRLSAVNILLAAAGAQVLLWTLIPALGFHTVPLDVAENIAWGQEWQLGYYKHPPLQAWLTGAVFQLSNGSAWPIYLLSQLAIVTCFAAIWQMGRGVVDDSGRLLAVAFFSLLYYANVPTPEFNANVLQMPFWALAPWLLWRAINTNRLWWWVALGVTVMLAFYTKYSAILLGGALTLAALSVPQGRAALRTPGPYVAAAVAALLLAPHAVWLVESGFMPFQYAQDRSAPLSGLGRITGPLMFLAAQIADHAGALVLVAAGIAGRMSLRLRLPAWTQIANMPPDERYILISAFAPVMLAVLLGAGKGMGLRDMWGAPMFTYTGLAAAIWLRPHMLRLRQTAMAAVWAVLFVGAPVGVGVAALAGPYFGAKPSRTAYPGPELAAQLETLWKARTGRDLTMTAGPTWETGVLAAYASRHPSALVDGDHTKSPWITPERLAAEGVLVIWPADQRLAPPAGLARLGPFAATGSLALPYVNSTRNASINWAIVAPASPKEAPRP